MGEREDDVDRQISILTTLHYVIQTQRMGTISEATGRAGMFLTAVSMALVALGFIAQATELNADFYAFAFALIAALLLIGLSTFLRLVQLGAEDGSLAMVAERIREFYAEAAPGVERWFAMPFAKGKNIGENAVAVRSRFQLLMPASSMIAAVNSALAAVAVALALSRLLGMALASASLGGLLAFALAFAVHLVVSRRIWTKVERDMDTNATGADGQQSVDH